MNDQSVFFIWLKSPGVNALLLGFGTENRVKEAVQGITGNKTGSQNFHRRAPFFTPDTDDDDAQHNTSDHCPTGHNAVDQQTSSQQKTKLAFRPADELNKCAWNGPNHETVSDTRLRAGLNSFGIHAGNRRDQILSEVTNVREPDHRDGNDKGDQCSK